MPARRNDTASEAPSRPTDTEAPSLPGPTISHSARTYGFVRDTCAGGKMNVRLISMSGIARISSRISPGSWLGR